MGRSMSVSMSAADCQTCNRCSSLRVLALKHALSAKYLNSFDRRCLVNCFVCASSMGGLVLVLVLFISQYLF